jgi:alpha-1,6-mannosyltransferase
VRFVGHLRDRAELAALLATADVALAPGPIETFGLAALEVIGAAGLAAASDVSYGAAVRTLLNRPDRRVAARARAEQFPWSASVAGFLSIVTAGRASASQRT